jgi:cytochrome oxidase Cu insertion factor (SCO1/SenC/PrrC family)
MEKEIERLFRVPNRILQEVLTNYSKKKRFNTAFLFTNEELLEQLDKADAAMRKAEDDFDIRLENKTVSFDDFQEFMIAKANYLLESNNARDLIISRQNPINAILASI